MQGKSHRCYSIFFPSSGVSVHDIPLGFVDIIISGLPTLWPSVGIIFLQIAWTFAVQRRAIPQLPGTRHAAYMRGSFLQLYVSAPPMKLETWKLDRHPILRHRQPKDLCRPESWVRDAPIRWATARCRSVPWRTECSMEERPMGVPRAHPRCPRLRPHGQSKPRDARARAAVRGDVLRAGACGTTP